MVLKWYLAVNPNLPLLMLAYIKGIKHEPQGSRKRHFLLTDKTNPAMAPEGWRDNSIPQGECYSETGRMEKPQ